MNLVFHVVSALAFLILMLWLVRLQQQQKLLQQLIAEQSGQARPTVVQWPDKFLQQFCYSLAINLELPAKVGAATFTRPVRIRTEGIFSLHLYYGIQKVALICRHAQEPEINIIVSKDLSADSGSDMIQALQEAIPGVNITVVAASAASLGRK